ncbi:hypothetical protein CWATWH8502_2706 [Crocosphaera watsonii WH 8502]|uniref:Uncharacterized protein n=2 Tax=Crocosphaera watsonii TaxID=263511 RepID=T2JU20_CROWT|nr:hypothetical protein CWATWH8502_2706 [Crocosphaera watsonii WH 8502]CCQ69303.1 hypothetical protein CWATWH0402_1407 [Crocosphaera watsonii WH 0402]
MRPKAMQRGLGGSHQGATASRRAGLEPLIFRSIYPSSIDFSP